VSLWEGKEKKKRTVWAQGRQNSGADRRNRANGGEQSGNGAIWVGLVGGRLWGQQIKKRRDRVLRAERTEGNDKRRTINACVSGGERGRG